MKKFITLIALLILSGCTAPKTAAPTMPLQTLPATIVTRPLKTTAVESPIPSSTSLPSNTPAVPVPTNTLKAAPTRTIFPSSSEASTLGTPVPGPLEPITRENYEQLKLVAQWGNGNILDSAFAPDGSFFVVRSISGVAVYDPLNLDVPPRWIEFPDELISRKMDVSMDGKYLLLTEEPATISNDDPYQQVFELSTRAISRDPADREWYQPAFWSAYLLEDIVAVSPDGKYQLRTGIRPTLPGNSPDAVREVTDAQNGTLYYELADPLTYVAFGQNARPQGCDVQYFTPGGVEPALMAPVLVEFASNSESFAILYYAASFYGWKEIRVYNTSDGQLLATYGSYEQPAVDFDYVPGQETLLVSYEDGSINLWDVRRNRSTWQSRDFQAITEVAAISSDGKSILLSSKFGLEVHSLTDGSLQGQYDPTAFVASPVENIMALGQENGDIEIRKIPSGENIYYLKGHQAEIYGMAFSPDGRYLASSSYDCTVRLWDMQAGEYVRSFEEPTVTWSGRHTRMHARNLVFIPGMDTLMGFGTWHNIVKWEISTGITQEVIQSSIEDREHQFPSGEERVFYIVNHDFFLETGTLRGPFPPPPGFPTGCSPYGPETFDGTLRFTVGSDALTGYICVINISDWNVIAYLPVIRDGAMNPVYAGKLFISPDGTELITVSYNGVIYVFQIDQNF